MKRTSGRIGVGLVLVSTLVGACLSEQERGDALALAVTQPEAAVAPALEARDVVLAVREQLDRGFGKTNNTFTSSLVPSNLLNSFEWVGNRTTPAVELLRMSNDTGELRKTAAEVILPDRADGAFRVRDASSGMTVDVGLVGATTSVREEVNGYAVYRAGYAHGAHIVQRPSAQGTEDYVFFPEKLPDAPQIRYEVSLGQTVAGLRLVERTLEMLDASGAPRLRMAPPYAVDGDGRRLALDVAIEGCAYDTSSELPWDRPVVAPGAAHCTVRLSWDPTARAPLTVDPAWAATGEMSVPRFNATSAELPGSTATKLRVIVVGGDPGDPTKAYKTTEVFDEQSNTWTMGKSMAEARTQHAMVTINAGNTAMLVVTGGRNSTGVLASVERLDASGAGWQKLGTTGLMTSPRALHTATVAFLEGQPPTGHRIVVAGGVNHSGMTLDTFEVFFMNDTIWASPPLKMSSPRLGHTATMGKAPSTVIIAGGKTATAGPALASLDYFDSGSAPGVAPSMFAIPTPMVSARAYHKAIREQLMVAPYARIYFLGGESGENKVAGVDVYDGSMKAIVPEPSPALTNARSFHDALLVNGSALIGKGSKIVVTGGYGAANEPIKSVEWLDLTNTMPNKTWQTGPDMLTARAGHSMASVSEGRILVFGGVKDAKGTSEVLQCNADAECPPDKFCADGFCCNTPCKGVCEACNSTASGHTPGTCAPIAGKPLESHGSCEAPDGNAKCNGQCGGFERETCVYPEGKPCGTQCNNAGTDTLPSTVQSLTCTDKGACAPSGFESSCGVFKCSTMAPVCNTECKTDGDCIGGKKCDLPTKSCVEAQVRCSVRENTMPGLPPKEEVVESSADPYKVTERCGAFRCDQQKSECLKFCNTIYDCFDGFTCNTSNVCVKKETAFPNTVDEATSCSTSPAHESSRYGWLAALALAGALATRRNRPRA